jgi:predicted Fe-Mo cluster-binding NifX family protein
MKIAVPTRDNHIDDHFGHCAYYTIYTVENGKIVDKTTMPSPEGCGCKSNVAYQLQEMGVKLMLAGNMGEGAKNKLGSCQIEVIRGCSGPIENVIGDYLNGKITDSGVGCASHEGHHQCHGGE